MINHYQNVKITDGNEFSLLVPIKTRSYNENGSFIDEVIDARTLTECVVTFGNVEYEPQLLKEGVLINLPANLARATYSVIVTAKHSGVAIRAALFQAVTIVAWSYQSNAEQFLPNSPIVLDSAFVIRPIGQRDIALETTYGYLRSRLLGNAKYGIPAKMPIIENGVVLDESLANLDRYLHLLDGMKIRGINPEIQDGVNLGRLLCDKTMGVMVTEVIDDSTAPWTYENPLTEFPQVRKILLRFNAVSMSASLFSGLSELEELELPEWESGVPTNKGSVIISNPLLRVVRAPKWTGLFRWYDTYAFYNDPALEILNIQSFKNINNSNAAFVFRGLTALRYCRLGKLEQWEWRGASASNGGFFAESANLIHLEIGKDTAISWNVFGWSPTNALDASRTDLIEESSTATNNLEQFLSNFQTYIADRVANRTWQTALTLTLSSAVYAALEAQEGQTILATLANKNWTVAQA